MSIFCTIVSNIQKRENGEKQREEGRYQASLSMINANIISLFSISYININEYFTQAANLNI